MTPDPRQSSSSRPPVRIPWDTVQTRPTQPEHAESQPLTSGELSHLDRVTRRVHAELRTLINAFPAHARNASELSRQLGVDRTTCHRIVSEVQTPYKGPETAVRLPGAKGLAQFTQAIRGKGVSLELVDSAEAAVQQLAQAIRAIAGSQSRLGRRFQAEHRHESSPASSDGPAGEHHAREQIHDAGAFLTGHATDISIATLIFRPHPEDPTRLDRAQLRAFLGHRMRRDAMPFSLFWFEGSEPNLPPENALNFATLDRKRVRGLSQGVVLSEFSTDPLPLVTSRGPSSRTILQIDPRDLDEGEPFDLVLAGRADANEVHPTHDDPPVHEVWKLGRYPERVLVFDTYLHRSMARACIPTAGAFLVSPFLGETMAYRWLDRYPTTPPLEVLSNGIAHASHPARARYGEMLSHLFDRIGWDPNEFVGYRCTIERPIFSAGYCMTFDYSTQAPPS